MGSIVRKITKPIKKIVKSPVGKAALIGAIGFGIPGAPGALGGGLFGRAKMFGPAQGLFGTKGIGPLLSGINPFAAGSVERGTGLVTGEGFLRPALRGFNRLGTTGKVLTVGGLGAGLGALLAPQGEEESDEDFAQRQSRVEPYLRQYYQNVNPNASQSEVDDFVNRNLSEYRAMGGMVGQGIMSMGMPRNMYLEGGKVYLEEGGRPEDFMYPTDDMSGVIYQDPEGKPITKEEFFRRTMEAEEEEKRKSNKVMPKPKPGGLMDEAKKQELLEMINFLDSRGIEKNQFTEDSKEKLIKQFLDIDKDKEAPSIKKAEGGMAEKIPSSKEQREEDYILGLYKIRDIQKKLPNRDLSEDFPGVTNDVLASFLSKRERGMPMKEIQTDLIQTYGAANYSRFMNTLKKQGLGDFETTKKAEGGIAEIDLREKGGFVPMGKKEKADDVPAMLSKNEFVLTADAVRGIGDGNVEKGAQRLYDLMGEAEKAGRGVA